MARRFAGVAMTALGCFLLGRNAAFFGIAPLATILAALWLVLRGNELLRGPSR